MANKFWPATELTDGLGSLSSIPALDIADGDAAFVVRAGIVSFYRMDSESVLANDPPEVVAPDDVGGGTKRWIRIGGVGTEPVPEVFSVLDTGSCWAWLDFSDTATIEADGDNYISAIGNKSGNTAISYIASVNQADRASYESGTAGINSLPCAYFLDDTYSKNITIQPASEDEPKNFNGVTAFVVFSNAYQIAEGTDRKTGLYVGAYGAGWNVFVKHNVGGASSGLGVSANHYGHMFDAGFTGTDVRLLASDTGTGPWMRCTVLDPAGSQIELLNGTEHETKDVSGLSFPNLQMDVLIGGYSSNRALRDAYVGEVIIYDEPLGLTARQKVEGYLAHKWGLSADLPAEHPYKDSAP